jgi:hypothetical protein
MSEEITLHLNISDALYLCKEVIKRLGWNIEKIEGNTITTSTGFSLRSWGEIIIIHLEKIYIDEAKMYVESEPKSQIIDWGKSRENEQLFINKLSEIGGINI